MSPKDAVNLMKKIGKQKYTSEGVPIEWYGRDWQFYKLVMKNFFDEHKMSDMIHERYDKPIW